MSETIHKPPCISIPEPISIPRAVVRNDLSIISWNIHDGLDAREGLKTGQEDFAKILSGCSVFCLQETKREINFPNYRCFNQLRSNSRSGGLCIGVHRSISDNVKLLKTKYEDIQAVSITPDPSDPNSKFTLINVYDSPENSSFKSKRKLSDRDQLTTLDQLTDLLAKNNYGETILVGDFNARTRDSNHEFDQPDEFINNTNPIDTRSHPLKSNRNSRDSVLNARGKLLVDFMACADMTILNGNMLGDIFGDFTCHNYNGCSLVDYIAVTRKIYHMIDRLEVLELTSFSDHKPCRCVLRTRNAFISPDGIMGQLENAPIKYKWDTETGATYTQFKAAQTSDTFKHNAQSCANTTCKCEKDVYALNSAIVDLYAGLADKVMPKKDRKRDQPQRKKKNTKHRSKPKNPWFDGSCIILKRELKRLAIDHGKFPSNVNISNNYYAKRREYKQHIRSKKNSFIAELSKDIEAGKNINWNRFNKLRKMLHKENQLDVFDMANFCNFFKKLYSNPSLPEDKISQLHSEINVSQNSTTELSDILGESITLDELQNSIAFLKKGKAVAEDLVANEFLKASNQHTLSALLQLFNECLRLGVYPWNTSLVTPLHKKGSIYDPNNYRAIAVASNIGKLFSSILLNRLISFRSTAFPDTPNQLGFCKNAQTADHILTLSTIINKHVQIKKERLYSCFVDYAKAFDTVCREALLFKLWKYGVRGKFFDCLTHMYQNSKAKVKLLNKLSAKIDILTGTEQGHPMSPELFKCYIHELSEILNNMDDINVPTLNGVKITHLLWADDLVLLATDSYSLQKMIDRLHQYCSEWGLSVNIDKTAAMVFNRSGRLLKESHKFTYGDTTIPSARSYCYLGITFSLSGSFVPALQQLRQKGLRAYFSLKKTIDIRAMKKSTVFKLFDALVLPVASYACQVWLPSTFIVRELTNPTNGYHLPAIARDHLERLHISFLKWTMGVHKRTSNAAVWGDCGRYPLGITLLKQTFDYYERLRILDTQDSDCLARHAYKEQIALNLSWHSNLTMLRTVLETDNNGSSAILTSERIRENCRSKFVTFWNDERHSNRKLSFYNEVKHGFSVEPYLQTQLTYQQSKRLAQFRASAHRLNCETGRYGVHRANPIKRLCTVCSTTDLDTLHNMSELPLADLIIEDEYHVLRECPHYHDIRMNLSHSTKTHLFADTVKLFDADSVTETAKFILKIYRRRHPPKEKEKSTSS
jgi:exonuclease III